MDEWAQLTIEMYDGAKEHWHRCKDKQSQLQNVFGEPWQLWIAQTRTKEMATNISERIDWLVVCKFWEEKGWFGSGM